MGRAGSVLDGLRLALTTLTVARLAGPRTLDQRTAGMAMSLAPLVGLLLGLVAAGVLTLVDALSAGPLLPAAAAVGALAALTRGLHLDGLTDTVDGLASYLPPERARQVMKAPDVGALGMVTVVLSLVLQVAALSASTASGRGAIAVVLAAVIARIAVAAACTPATPAATHDGLGALVAGTVRRGVPATTAAVVVSVAVLGTGTGDALRMVIAVATGLCAARILRRHAVRRLGGVTGDVLGALVEVSTTVVLIVMALGG